MLARRLGLGRGLALALAALTVAVPDMVYAGWILAETVAYPLALAAVVAGVLVLASPSRKGQLAFLALAALATGTRAQFAVLFVVYPVAVDRCSVSPSGACEPLRASRHSHSRCSGAAIGAAFAVGPSRFLGMYRDVLGADVEPALLVERMGSNALVLAYASAWILIPGAILGFGLALARPRSRTERAFAAMAVPFVLALLLEASVFATPQHVQERYAFYALPLLALSFGLYAARGWPLRLAHAGIAAALLCVSALAPLSGYTPGDGKTQSAFLLGLGRLEELMGDSSGAALLAAALAGACLLTAIAASTRPRFGTPVVLALAPSGSPPSPLPARPPSTCATRSEPVRRCCLPTRRGSTTRSTGRSPCSARPAASARRRSSSSSGIPRSTGSPSCPEPFGSTPSRRTR